MSMTKGLRIEELRATNYVRDFEGKEGEVAELGNFSYFSWIEEDWSGIPLTEEWLKRFGFVLTVDDLFGEYSYWKKEREFPEPEFGMMVNGEEGSSKLKFWCGAWSGNHIEYVHHLQNLYFA